MSTAIHTPLSERINFRLVFFICLISIPLGWVGYVFLDSAIHGGVKDLGDGYVEVDLKAMSLFPFDQINGKREDVPSKWRELDGKKVVVYGEMWQPYNAGPTSPAGFQLVYSRAKCCFSGPPQIQHFVQATLKPGANAAYVDNLAKIKGTLHVDVTRDADKVSSVYHIEVESVEEVN